MSTQIGAMRPAAKQARPKKPTVLQSRKLAAQKPPYREVFSKNKLWKDVMDTVGKNVKRFDHLRQTKQRQRKRPGMWWEN